MIKNICFLFITLLLINKESIAQTCSRVAEFQNGPDYPVDGNATLTKQINGTLTLSISSDFATTPGPDLHFLLSNSPTPNAPYYIVSQIQSASGAQSFTIPASIDINQYQYVLIHCIQFNHFWGAGTLGNTIGNCNLSSGFGSNTIDKKIASFPNPVKNEINFAEIGELSVFSLEGKLLFLEKSLTKRFDLSTLESGFYTYSFLTDKGSISKGKFLKQ